MGMMRSAEPERNGSIVFPSVLFVLRLLWCVCVCEASNGSGRTANTVSTLSNALRSSQSPITLRPAIFVSFQSQDLISFSYLRSKKPSCPESGSRVCSLRIFAPVCGLLCGRPALLFPLGLQESIWCPLLRFRELTQVQMKTGWTPGHGGPLQIDSGGGEIDVCWCRLLESQAVSRWTRKVSGRRHRGHFTDLVSHLNNKEASRRATLLLWAQSGAMQRRGGGGGGGQ